MKKDIRKKLLEKRNSLSTYEILERSNRILEKLKKLEKFEKASTLACYISFGSEVYTHGLIKEYVGKKKVLVPVVSKEKKEIFLAHIKSWRELESGTYGILEPRKEFLRPVSYDEVEVIIVPGIAFDENGNRIGYGEGYFDKLLKKIHAVKIAIAYDFQILKKIPNEKHDVKIDVIITEKRIIECSQN